MKVFRVRLDVNKYQYIVPDESEPSRVLRTDGSSKEDIWTLPKVYIPYPMRMHGGFYQPNDTVFITDEHATQALYYHFIIAGDLLPLPFDGQMFTVLNVTKCIDVRLLGTHR